jgi:uncharacterized protein (TIGR02302 family)
MSGPTPRTLDGKIAAARLAIALERLWAVLLWPFVAGSLLLALLYSGFLPLLPTLLAQGLLVLAAAALVFSLAGVSAFRWPSRVAAMRRIELASALAHRPVSSLDDRLAEGDDGPAQQVLWLAHKERELARLADARVGPPRSAWPRRDARALRLPAFLVLLASLILGPGEPTTSVMAGLGASPAATAAGPSLDAWVKPPTYTGKPPVMLTSPAMVERLKSDPDILVPENSALTVRLTGVSGAKLSFRDVAQAGSDGPDLSGLAPTSKTVDGVFQAEARLTRPALALLTDANGRELARWHLLLVPDAPPTIAFTEDPAGDSSGALTVKWKAADDYGVAGITAEISLADQQEDGMGFAGNGIFLYEPPKFLVNLRRAYPREEAGTSTAALAEHPWAGFMVDMTLTARDAAGHQTVSEIKNFKMPEKMFVKPLARALIEQRSHLILAPDEQGQVAEMLTALLAYPKGLIDGSGNYLAIATIASRLRATASQDDVDEAVNLLWQTAVAIEDGALANARAELESLRRELEKALAEGAPPERIKELMDKMRSAMDRYLQSMADEMAKRQQDPGQSQLDPSQQQTITQDELRRMLDTIEKLSQSGANDAARQMLSQLDDILRNLQPGQQRMGNSQQGNNELGKMLDQLTDIMRKQQKLMDDTQRMQQGQGDQSDPSSREPNGQGQNFSPDALAGQQDDIGQMLQELMRGLGRNGLDVPQAFGDAGRSMKGSEGALRREDQEEALTRQGDAISKLREGAQGMAQQLMQRGQGQQGNYGRHGEARGDNRDPLGRPMPNLGEDFGPDRNMLPTEQALRRAREILDTLRERASEAGRPRLELDYIDRLLRGLY